jgi:acyl-CoA thioesterase I
MKPLEWHKIGVECSRRAALLLGVVMLVALSALWRPAFSATPSILIYGDSLSAAYGLSASEGWVHLLERRLPKSPAWRVVNRSLSGETTHGGQQRFERVLGQVRPRVVVLALGANDALRGLSLSHTEQNLRDMIRAARQAGSEVVLVGIAVPPNYGATYANQFQAIFPRLAKAEEVRLVPFMLEGFATDLRYFQADRIHPNAAAQPRILDTIWAVLSPLLEQGR